MTPRHSELTESMHTPGGPPQLSRYMTVIFLRQKDIATSFWCNNDIITSCAYWEYKDAILLVQEYPLQRWESLMTTLSLWRESPLQKQ